MLYNDSFEVNDHRLNWGTTIHEAAKVLGAEVRPRMHTRWFDIDIKGSTILDLKCSRINLSASGAGPIMNVIYYLSPVQNISDTDLHSVYVNHLSAKLGEPAKQEDLYKSSVLFGKYTSGNVIYTAKWEAPAIRIGLSVFGGVRDEKDNVHAAWLYVDWLDEISAAQPLLELLKPEIDFLSNYFSSDNDWRKFSLKWSPRKYYRQHAANPVPDEAETNDVLRAAQLALYKHNCIITPQAISKLLSEDEFAVYRIKDKCYLSTKHDTTFFTGDDNSSIVLTQVHPARGSGHWELHTGGLSFRDTPEGKALLDAANWLSRISGKKIVMQEGWDD